MTVGEAINRVQSLYSRGAASDSSRLEDRYIYNLIKTARSMAAANSFWLSGGWEYMAICAELVAAKPEECGCNPSFGTTFWRTKKPIPTPLKRNGNNLVSVSSMDGTMSVSETTWEAARYRSGNRYKTNEYFIKNGNLYFLSVRERIKTLSVNGVWFDPVEAAQYGGDLKGVNDVELGVSPELWAHIFEIVKDELSAYIQMEEDGTTDSSDRPVK